MENQSYISIPILDELVAFVENGSVYEDAVKSMGSGILNYYFPAINGYSVGPEQNRNNFYPDSIIFRIQRRWAGDRGLVDHTLAEATKAADALEPSLAQLTTALENAITEHGRCWAVLFHGCEIRFYEYHDNLPLKHRLVQWAEAGDPAETVYHVRNNSGTIDRMLCHMGQTAEPPIRL
ncbi:Uncharacterized protein BP5553_01207 [Venustampulla echinocandica]|uniref:Uncharacterized protein n=1 Tax=Venustampulla echinocandica TaxID=2656787 RepID=A0A370U0C7_9HELO|nr:Uncharacterized protein BP5553_01207 [Venustampulla echinocandica]RDL41228.1 Uncharacterized protein BP5553_01207 [Venustampulla echinocandica]